MSRAIVPDTVPALPEGATGWRRSSKGGRGMYHAHALGATVCGRLRLDRHASESPRHLGDLRYWGVCPVCYARAPKP